MPESVVLDKANKLKDGENYDLLRKEGIQRIEKLAGNLWTDYNIHDPGITLLEALCYAITDLSYRTGFEMKDLVAPETLKPDSWKQIFYTARQILPCNPVTINDLRRLLIDIPGIRNAWITISKDYEIPIYISYPNEMKPDEKNPCNEPDKMLVKLAFGEDPNLATRDRIIELNGLYKIIIEFEEGVTDSRQEKKVREIVLNQLHSHRNLCEDYLAVTAAEYRDFTLSAEIFLKDNADPEMTLAELCFRVQNYFTPSTKFYTLEELLEKKMRPEEIFEGPFLIHGFITDEDLDKNDLFRDMHLSDIINSVGDIEEVIALKKFKVNDALTGIDDKDDTCSNEAFFDEWIAGMKNERLVGRLDIKGLIEHINDKDVFPEEEGDPPIPAPFKIFKGDGRVTINTDRFRKLLKDLKTLDSNKKLVGQNKDFIVPVGENMEITGYYPVQYSLPETYKVGEHGLPRKEGNKRLVQALQLKGYLAVFEQLLMNFLAQLGNLNELFSFKEIDKTSFTQKIVDYDESKVPPFTAEITGYLYLYVSSEQYIKNQQLITESTSQFEIRRNRMLDHLLARFSEQMEEYGLLMKYFRPDDHLSRLIKNKTDLLSDYIEISHNRGRAYNYQLKEEGEDDTGTEEDEKLISQNVSGTEKRISRLIGMKNYGRKCIAPDNFILEQKDPDDPKSPGRVRLYEDADKKNWLLESEEFDTTCEDEIMHCFIDAGCCKNNFIKYPEQKEKVRRKKFPNKGYGFVLKDEKHENIAASPSYKTKEERDSALKKAIAALDKICHDEDLHLVEHILLRPRGDDAVEIVVEKGKHAETPAKEKPILFELLDACLDRCDLNLKFNTGKDVLLYKFDITKLKKKDCKDNMFWVVELKRLLSAAERRPEETIFKATFPKYEDASAFISTIREYGSELSNFKIFKTYDEPAQFYFRLSDKNGRMLFETLGCYKKATPNQVFKKKDIREDEKPGKITVYQFPDAIVEVMKLKIFLAYELDLYCCEDPCDHNEDPYSFRVSYVLPCWPKRFRDKSFRSFVERTIYAETPAHIHAKVYWLGVEQMRRYESALGEWRIEMAANDVPDNSIASDYTRVVKELKNCDEPCKKKEEEEVDD